MSEADVREVYFLAGPTATGKTAVAHQLARDHGWAVLSADAMLVYRGMDIGTAKPAPEARAGILYGGVDLITPDQPFSVGAWLDHARAFLRSVPRGQRVVVAGGTGLYIKALLYGLDPMPSADAAVRRAVEALYAQDGLAGLQRACREADAGRYAAIRDPSNPRRVMRALELAWMGVPMKNVWQDASPCRVVMLDMDRQALGDRIAERVETMYRAGFLDEVRRLRDSYPVWSDTAGKAIGYLEALALLNGEMSEKTAKEETVRRTTRLVRRQTTWFRNQLDVAPVAVADDGDDMTDLAERVYAHWSDYGACSIAC